MKGLGFSGMPLCRFPWALMGCLFRLHWTVQGFRGFFSVSGVRIDRFMLFEVLGLLGCWYFPPSPGFMHEGPHVFHHLGSSLGDSSLLKFQQGYLDLESEIYFSLRGLSGSISLDWSENLVSMFRMD